MAACVLYRMTVHVAMCARKTVMTGPRFMEFTVEACQSNKVPIRLKFCREESCPSWIIMNKKKDPTNLPSLYYQQQRRLPQQP